MRGLILAGLLALSSVLGAAGGYKLNSLSTTSFAGVSYTALPITLTAIATNSTKPLAVFISAQGPAAGFYWRIVPANITPTFFHYQAVSTTPLLIDNLEKTQLLWVKAASTTAPITLVLDVCEQNNPGY